jgi:transposase-like protein
MGKPYSTDLRERAVAAVLRGGLSRHKSAAQFGVGISTVINWVRRFQDTGSVAPGQMGAQAEGDCRRASGLSGPARPGRRVHAARARARTRRARPQGRLSIGVEFRPRRKV